MEALAASKAFEFELEVRMHQVVLEGDSKVVIKALEIEESDSMAYGLLLKDASLFSSSFSKLSYSHTKRDDNKVAHILARLVVNYPKCTV